MQFKDMSNLVFCHGHRHLEPKFPSNFMLVDIESKNKPDIVADFLAPTFLNKLPSKSVDTMIFMACPYTLFLSPRFPKLLQKLKINGTLLFLQDWKLTDWDAWEFVVDSPVIDNLELNAYSDPEIPSDKFIKTKDWLIPVMNAWKNVVLNLYIEC